MPASQPILTHSRLLPQGKETYAQGTGQIIEKKASGGAIEGIHNESTGHLPSGPQKPAYLPTVKALRLQEKLDPAIYSDIVKSLSPVQFFATPWTVAYQAPLSMGFSRQ